MARIFQKYVTSEGRSTIPEIENLRTVSAGPRPGEEVKSKLGGSAVGLDSFMDESESDPESLDIEKAVSMYLVMKGIRNMIQYFKKM